MYKISTPGMYASVILNGETIISTGTGFCPSTTRKVLVNAVYFCQRGVAQDKEKTWIDLSVALFAGIL